MDKGVNIVITNNKDEILIFKRSSSEFNYPNLWDLPGGKVEHGETLQEAAKREAKEEGGLNIEPEQNYFYVYCCQDKELDIYGFKADLIGGDILLSKEHIGFKWVSKNGWKDLRYTPSVRATIGEFFRIKIKDVNTDSSFEKRFNGKLREVFLYITSRCNLKCPYCYMGDAKNINMDIDALKIFLKKIINLGATKITFLGGEPTLHPLLPNFIKIAKDLGYNYIRLDTNGEFNPCLLDNSDLKKLSDICFSLDGISPETHAKTRTIRNYYSTIENIKKAILMGYKVRVTMTVSFFNLHQIEKMAAKLEKIGVSALNVHLVSKNGRAKNNELLLVEESKWIDAYKKIFPKLTKYNIKIKIPKRYIKESECQNYGVTCESAKSSRILISSDFKIYSCPLLLDSDRYFACFRKGKFYYTKNYKENIFEYSNIDGPICPILMEDNFNKYKDKNIIPICVSYKQTNK